MNYKDTKRILTGCLELIIQNTDMMAVTSKQFGLIARGFKMLEKGKISWRALKIYNHKINKEGLSLLKK